MCYPPPPLPPVSKHRQDVTVSPPCGAWTRWCPDTGGGGGYHMLKTTAEFQCRYAQRSLNNQTGSSDQKMPRVQRTRNHQNGVSSSVPFLRLDDYHGGSFCHRIPCATPWSTDGGSFKWAKRLGPGFLWGDDACVAAIWVLLCLESAQPKRFSALACGGFSLWVQFNGQPPLPLKNGNEKKQVYDDPPTKVECYWFPVWVRPAPSPEGVEWTTGPSNEWWPILAPRCSQAG